MKKETWLLIALALLKLFLPYLLQNSAYEPHRDEFLYLAEAHHMAWGYMEIPPLLSVFAWLVNLFGGGIFWIKFWPSLGGALTFLLVGRLVLLEGGKAFAVFLVWTSFMVTGFLSVHFLFQGNFLDVFFWTAIGYAFVRYERTRENKFLYLAGICMGLGMLAKYSAALYIFAILVGLVLTPARRVFSNRHFYIACGIGFLIFLPNLLWQYRHGFPVVFHMGELQKYQLQYVSPFTFLFNQLLIFGPCVAIWIVGLFYLAFVKAVKPYRFLAWAYLVVIVLLLIAHGKDYYAMGAYPLLFCFGAVRLESRMRGRRVFWRYVLTAFILFTGYFIVELAMPILPPAQLAALYGRLRVARLGVLRWEDGENHALRQDFADMLSWKEMTAKVAKAYNLLDSSEKAHTLLFCDNYGEAGAVNYYGSQYHLPEAYSDNASFLYWMPADYDHYDNIVLLTDDQHEMEHPFIHDFKQAVLVDSVTNRYAREYGDLIILLKGPDSAFRTMFQEKIDKDKRKTAPEATYRH